MCREISPCATRWRGKKGKIGREPTERCVRKFRPVPRGGAKKGKIGQGPREQCVEKFRPVPRGGVKRKRNDRRSMIGRGPIERCVRKVRRVPRGGMKKEIRLGTLCATSFGFVPFAFSHEVA